MPIAQTISTHNLMQTFDSGAEFIAPPEGPARVYLEVIAQVEALMRQAALTVNLPNTQQESGIALQLRFQALNASLVHFARRMEDFERRVWELVGRWLGMEPQVSVSWGKDFSIADLKTELENCPEHECFECSARLSAGEVEAAHSVGFGDVAG